MRGASPTPCRPRDNPFRSGRVAALAFRGPTTEEILERFEACGRRGALVGPCGTGKSTLLRALHAGLEERGWRIEAWTLRADTPPHGARTLTRRAHALDRSTVWTIDGAEQLGPFAWRAALRASRRSAGFLITTHTPGRLPTLHTHDSPLSRALELAEALDPALRNDPSGHARIESLHRHHGGNLRTVFEELYLDRAHSGTPASPVE